MKKKIQNALALMVKSDALWLAVKPWSKVGSFLVAVRAPIDRDRERREVAASFFKGADALVVQSGPFRGMRYPVIDAVGSSIAPKLLGTYERELHPALERLLGNRYSEIVDVGCAEGYYAVGLALAVPGAKVYAYDTDAKARALCAAMAAVNGVADRVSVRGEMTAAALAAFPFSGRGLVLSDCEGFERELFTEASVANLRRCDVVIEAHDAADIGISTYLKGLFGKTHDIESVYSVDDIQKALSYDAPALAGLPLAERKRLLAEERGVVMEWLVCRPKSGV